MSVLRGLTEDAYRVDMVDMGVEIQLGSRLENQRDRETCAGVSNKEL